MEKKIAHYFATYKDSKECFSTSNGFLFHKEHDAKAHADTLGDKEVEKHDRKDYPAVNEGDADKLAADEKKAADKKAADEKKAADKLAADEKKAADKKAADEKKAAEGK